MLKTIQKNAAVYLHPNYWFFEKRTKRNIIWATGVIPTFYGADQSLFLGVWNRTSHIFGNLDVNDSRKHLNERLREWKSNEHNVSILSSYNSLSTGSELLGRKAYRTCSLEDNIICNGGTSEFSFTERNPRRINYVSFRNEVKGEALRSLLVTIAHSFLDSLFGQVQGIMNILKKVIKLLIGGILKGYVNGAILLEVINEFIAEGIAIALQGFIPFLATHAGKTGLKTGLKKLVDAARKNELELFYPEDAWLEAVKGMIKGVYKDLYSWLFSGHNVGVVLGPFLGSILGPIVAAGMINIFITQALA